MQLRNIFAAAAVLVFVTGVARAQTAPPDSNATSRPVQTDQSGGRNVEDDGAAGNNSTDDSGAINSTIAHFANAGRVNLQGGYAVGDSITLQNKAQILQGAGCCGLDNAPPYQGFLHSLCGVSGKPMILLQDTIGANVRDLHLIGNSSCPPSSAIEMNQAMGRGATTEEFNQVENVFIGPMFGNDSDPGQQFIDGIDCAGTVNEDGNRFSFVHIFKVSGVAFNCTNANASDTLLDTFVIQTSPIGVQTAAKLTMLNSFIGASSREDFNLLTAGGVIGVNTQGESSSTFLQFNGNSALYVGLGGGWQSGGSGGGFALPSSGIMLSTNNSEAVIVDLQDWHLQNANPGSSPSPRMVLANTNSSTSTVFSRLMGTWGVYPNNLNFGALVGPNDQRTIIYCPAIEAGQDITPCDTQRFDWNHTEDRSYQVFRNDFDGKVNVFGGPLYVRQLHPPAAVVATVASGSGATTWYYKVTALTYDGGETAASSEARVANASTLSSAAANRITFTPSAGAYAYNIYRGTSSGGEAYLATWTWNQMHPGNGDIYETNNQGFLDNGANKPTTRSPPGVDNTGAALIEGPLTAGAFIRPTLTTVAGLTDIDASPQAGDRAAVSDAARCVANSIVTGGGSISCALIYSGSAWKAEVTH